MFKSRKPSWPDPEKSIGAMSELIGNNFCWEATGPALELFEQELAGRIERIFCDHKDDLEREEEVAKSYSFHMWMIGRTAATARPTIVLTSRSKKLREKAKRLIRDDGMLQSFPGIDIKGLERSPAIPRGDPPSNGEERSDEVYVDGYPPVKFGTSITIGGKHRATLGGIVYVNGICYGMTALHRNLFNSESWDEESGTICDAEAAFDEDSDTEATSEYSPLPSPRGSASSTESGREDPSSSPLGSNSLLSVSNASSINDPVPNAVDLRDTQSVNGARTASFMAGIIDESLSGSELDYSLFAIDRSLLPYFENLYSLNSFSYQLRDNHVGIKEITAVAKSMQDVDILAAKESASVHGKLISNPYFVKFAGSKRFQKLWPVRLEQQIMPGDCGTWIISASSGDLYGHIVAADSQGRALITSATEAFDNIARATGVYPSFRSHFSVRCPSPLPMICPKPLSIEYQYCPPASPPESTFDSGGSKYPERILSHGPDLPPLLDLPPLKVYNPYSSWDSELDLYSRSPHPMSYKFDAQGSKNSEPTMPTSTDSLPRPRVMKPPKFTRVRSILSHLTELTFRRRITEPVYRETRSKDREPYHAGENTYGGLAYLREQGTKGHVNNEIDQSACAPLGPRSE